MDWTLPLQALAERLPPQAYRDVLELDEALSTGGPAHDLAWARGVLAGLGWSPAAVERFVLEALADAPLDALDAEELAFAGRAARERGDRGRGQAAWVHGLVAAGRGRRRATRRAA